MPSETLHRRHAVSELLLKSWDGFTACYSLPLKLLAMPIKQGVKPPWMALRRISSFSVQAQ
ncbi:hypothetical protein [Alteromonas mediterranea]|uniref:hypothetical protein n=1 Tax=Alteromonas mediterranea TaxID=314275 RepID=UPI0012DB7511|nr:hypothetical protein [Alteromonas mediterranea]